MSFRLRIASAALLALLGIAGTTSVSADGFEVAPQYAGPRPPAHRHHGLPLHHLRRHARMLPPDVAYRDPRMPRSRSAVVIQAYLPRYTEVPMYNEPPPRFPQR